jgi:hypothetical protein
MAPREILSGTYDARFGKMTIIPANEGRETRREELPRSADDRSNAGGPRRVPAPVDALIMKGGGVKGLAFAGAVRELQAHFQFQAFVGTSAGRSLPSFWPRVQAPRILSESFDKNLSASSSTGKLGRL